MDLSSLKQKGGNYLFAFLIFLFAIDPTNTIFHLKDVAFVLLMAYNVVFFKPDYRKFLYFAVGCLAITLGWLFATMRGMVTDGDFCFILYKSLAPLLLLPWIHHYDVLRLSRWPVFCTGFLIIMLFWIIVFIPQTETAIYLFMRKSDDTIMMSWRAFLGIRVFCMYHKSTVSFLLVFAIAFYQTIHKERRTFQAVMVALVLIHTFVISGTRSTMLLPFLLMGLIIFKFYHDKRYYNYVLYPVLGLAAVAFFLLLYKLLSETTEPSNMVKYAHLTSYGELFEENPLYFLWGEGPGTRFYSAGFHKMSLQTEWTYVELIRYMGVFCVLVLFLFLYPLVKIWKLRHRDDSCYVIAFAFFIYMIIAGTNPLLLSSTGMFTLLTVYSFLDRIETQRE
ncbi:MAG: ligase [Paraprevotella sp.]|nr:ligase [Paraprevotella sp.]